jgi:hypothetical protein
MTGLMQPEQLYITDLLTVSCNILSREQAKIGEDNSWRVAIGTDRKLIGDWACYLSCFIGIQNR